MKSDLLYRRRVLFLIIALCILCDVKCGRNVRAQAAEQIQTNKTAVDVARRAVPNAADRNIIVDALESSSAVIETQDKTIQQQDKQIERYKKAGKIAGFSLLGLIVSFWLWSKLRGRG